MAYKEIREAMLTKVKAVTSGYSEVTNQYDLEKNTENELVKGLAVRWGEGSPVAAQSGRVGFHHILNVVLTNGISVRESDNTAPEADTLYTDIETVIENVLDDQFLGIPSIMRGAKAPSISRPFMIKGNTIVAVEISFPIDFTLTINC